MAFDSAATNLVPGDSNNRTDVFIKDRETGVVTLVSVTAAGVQADRECYDPDLSPDGRYVVFSSQSTNLSPVPATGNHNLFLKDLQTGAIEQISVDSNGDALIGSAYEGIVSADGNLVMFSLEQFSPTYGFFVFLRNRSAGTTTLVSVSSGGDTADGASFGGGMSRDGRWITFHSNGSNLVDSDTNFSPDVFVRDLVNSTTVRASVDSGGNQATGASYDPTISDDGRFVVFRSSASDLVGNDVGGWEDVFLHDLQTGETARLSTAGTTVEADNNSASPKISASGAVVAFLSDAGNLVATDTNGTKDVFVAANPFFVATYRPDNRIGPVGSAVGLGNGIYNTTGLSQSFAATSRRAKVVRAALVIENDGNLEDDFLVRGSQGNRSFKIVYQDTGNRTAEVVAGTHATGAVDPGGADALTIIVTPNRKVLLKSVRRKGKVVKVWKRAEWRGTLTSNSQADGARSDTALFQVKHR